MFEIKCTDCGKAATVPFKPTIGKPAYCRTCFSKRTSKHQKGLSTNFKFARPKAWVRR
ncbi:MAG: hypothetical protein OEY24_05475 [Candidatus Bathyarchaeota archaeon]|nr:hypothetical protein [Candidatus Bathyarchaeota archaeon]MDH5495134.1 hypothetical protein [Candidatus Bathyarchaeota archaeon]